MDNRTNKMLIDATHPEETRVVVLRNGRVEEFDFESASRKLLRGNIYLAKVTRVEPSLQAAFVDYGGNRHGFLAFNEIHPDYYQIPMADRQALLEEEFAAEAEADAEADARAERRQQRGPGRHDDRGQDGGGAHAVDTDGEREGNGHDDPDMDERDGDEARDVAGSDRDGDVADMAAGGDERAGEPQRTVREASGLQDERLSPSEGERDDDETDGGAASDQPAADGGSEGGHIVEVAEAAEAPETIVSGSEAGAGEADALEELPDRPRRQRRRHYKIQEVIKRRQILLVQVVKEERGNKGAALTTYLSLAGRYTVLMPNTGRGGGISRKITQMQDRKRLKTIAQELDVPDGMGLIIRTAGASRTMQEIRRDYDYLLRLWESVRDLTLESTAPSLVYEEGNLIKRSIRDQYTKEVDEIVVAGVAAHREAQDFMRMLMPSHAKNVILHDRPEPLFSRYPVVERQLNAMFSPYVTLKSGGYLVINQTEALVAIDINSGKSTREFSIEETALNTNLEAADEIARQLKLRDLAGLIVIDFIDMEERRNNRKVENRLKDALRHDRARIQVGRISHFGLLEMSRQRMRTGVLEGSTSQCPHCQGTGIIRSVESVALAVLRGLEDHLQRDGRSSVNVVSNAEVALYILNHKRSFIVDMEHRYGIVIAVQASDRMQGSNFAIERSAAPVQPRRQPERAAVNMNWGFDGEAGEAADERGQAGGDADDPRPASVADARGDEPNIDEVEDRDEDRDGDDTRGREREARDDRGGRRRRRRRGRGRGGEREGGEDRYARRWPSAGGAPAGDDQPDEARRGDGRRDEGRRDEGRRDEARRDVGRNSPGEHEPLEAGGDDVRDVDSDVEGDGGDDRAPRMAGEGERDEPRRRRRRGRRGGRRGSRDGQPYGAADGEGNGRDEGGEEPRAAGADDGDDDVPRQAPHPDLEHASGSSAYAAEHDAGHAAEGHHSRSDPAHDEPAVTAETRVETPSDLRPDATAAAPTPVVEPIAEEPVRPARRGWWQRRVLGE